MKILARNRYAYFDFDLMEKMEAGLKLLGTEVKSVKKGNISLKGAFITIHNGEAYLTNATIPPWQTINAPENYDPTRPRKLLLKQEELKKIAGDKQAKGLTIVPICVYTKGSRVKLEIAVARGKRKYQKKQSIKERDIKRDMDRVIRGKDY